MTAECVLSAPSSCFITAQKGKALAKLVAGQPSPLAVAGLLAADTEIAVSDAARLAALTATNDDGVA